MKINITDIRNGSLDGKYVWICDYRHKDIANKPIRHVEPQKVLVRANDDKLSVYYSESHFAPLNPKGELTKKALAPFDNTGYRSYPGEPVQVFDNEQECRKAYVAACLEARRVNMCYQESVMNETHSRIALLNAIIENQEAQLA